MIELLRTIKKKYEDNNYECHIGEMDDVLIDVKPVVVLTPISENQSWDMLGNPSTKDVRFKIQTVLDHFEKAYDLEIEEAIEEMKKVLKSAEVKRHIVTYKNVETSSSLEENETVIMVTTNISLKLHRRLEWE